MGWWDDLNRNAQGLPVVGGFAQADPIGAALTWYFGPESRRQARIVAQVLSGDLSEEFQREWADMPDWSRKVVMGTLEGLGSPLTQFLPFASQTLHPSAAPDRQDDTQAQVQVTPSQADVGQPPAAAGNYATAYQQALAAGIDSGVATAIINAAQKYQIPAHLAFAVAYQESGWNPNAVGDGGHSVGLFQLNDEGEGYGMGDARYDPLTNAQTALSEFAAVRQADPSVVNDPGRWAALSQRPADPEGYASSVNGIYQGLQGGNWSSPSPISGRVPTGVPRANWPITPDGHAIQPGTREAKYYDMVKAVWNKIYAADPPWYAVQALMDTGIETTEQLQTVLESMPSDIPGLSIGQRDAAKTHMQKLSDQYFGRPVPDSLLKELASKGQADPVSIGLWFMTHAANEMPPDDYHAIWDAANKFTSGTWGTSPHPDTVYHLWTKTGGQATPPAASPAVPSEPVVGRPGFVA